jgi:hypothetical protein
MPRPIKVDFRAMASRNGSQEAAFEEFCCQIARRYPEVPDGSEFIRYRGAGGDGGVECIWRLPNGDEWGWQAKYIFNLQRVKAALDESVATAIKLHPKLTQYFICLPFDLTGPTARPGKSQRERFDDYRAEWEAHARAEGLRTSFSLLTPSTLLDDLHSFDPEGGRLRYWFDATVLGDDWFKRHLEEVKASAYPRYTPELRIQTPLAEALEALGLTDEWFESLTGRLKDFRNVLQGWKQSLTTKSDTGWGAVFPDAIQPQGEAAQNILSEVAYEFSRLVETRETSIDLSTLAARTNEALQLFRSVRSELATTFEAEHGEGTADSTYYKQFQAEYQGRFPAANIDSADEVIKLLEAFTTWVNSPVAPLPTRPELLILGQAGVGKTHGICDVAERRLARSLRTIVLFGERFAGAVEPWEQIRQQLGFDATLGRDALLAALDAAGEASGKPLLLCVDGLNETRPRTYWRTHLPVVIAQVRRYTGIRLCVSCRTTYELQVIPNTLHLPTVTHEGFEGIEFDACQEFFSHYGLEPPVTPVLQPEFSNPLFLRLICEAMVAGGHTRLPAGWQGINTAINALIKAKNEQYAVQHDVHPSNRFPERGLKAFIAAAEDARCPALPWDQASLAIDSVQPSPHSDGSLIDWLIREGMLIVDADGEAADESVRVAFERLGDHLLASKLLDPLDADALQTAFAANGPLAFACSELGAMNEYRGLVEALAVQLPERFGVELPDCVEGDMWDEVLKVAVEALPWRDPEILTQRTGQLLQRSLSIAGFAPSAFDAALSVSTYPSPIDALWLHRTLASRPMPQRDAFWCGYLHKGYEDRGHVEKLIRAAFQIDVAGVPEDTVERWATVLLWFCAAADRRVRDYATKALVRITEPFPLLWLRLIERFITVDDEYVVERSLAAAYGVLLRTRDAAAEAAIATVIYREVFTDSSRFQNALVRDYGRSILELAAHDGVLPEGVTEAEYLPPYISDWPLEIPAAETIEQYRHDRNLARLHHSCLHDDFFRYTLSVLSRYESAVDRPSMGRWIFQHVLDMGYSSQRFAHYDGYMLYRYGGGRGKPDWAERIGKKYQWIALARLIARLSDNVLPKKDRWDPEQIRTPLVYERGRDIDTSLLLRENTKERITSWWVPEWYDFGAVASLSDQEWTATHGDMPDSAAILAEKVDPAGKRWIMLEGFTRWSSKTEDMSYSTPYRDIWLFFHSYLVSRSESEKCWRWLRRQHFMGRWMPEGAEFHEGCIGEYPWATTFNVYPDTYMSRGDFEDKQPPCDMYPTCNSLSVTNEYDAYQTEGINFLLPARRFFEAEPLRWNGTSGYLSQTGELIFLDPSVIEPGPSALLTNAEFLKAFLAANDLVIIWTVLGEKLILVDHNAPRLTYSRVHMLTAKGLRSAEPVTVND